MYAGVIVDADAPGLSQPFTYRVPEELERAVFVGACVAVPFGSRELVGYIAELTETAPPLDEIKDLLSVIHDSCALNKPLLHLARWISDYYLAPLAYSAKAIVPEVMTANVSSTVLLLDPALASPASPNQQRLVEVLADLGGKSDSDILKARSRIEKFAPTLRQLKSRGAIEVIRSLELPKARPRLVRGLELSDDEFPVDQLESHAPKQAAIMKELSKADGAVRQSELLRKVGSSTSPARALVDKGLVEKTDLRVRRRAFDAPETVSQPLTPTEDQERALEIIRSSPVTLLYGVTGSGKTEVYLQSIARELEQGKGCIALVPEISLTTHLMGAYISRFGDEVAILHSRLSVGERHDEWRRIESGEARVVLGPRSAVFAPVRNLGLIVVDEEHEPSYKQDNSPRYNARTTAEERARNEGAGIILGSATPSVESFRRAQSGEIALARLDKRIDDRPMPTVELVDLREEFEQGRRSFFSDQLKAAVEDRLSKREQIILFVNRRGYASFILCRTCGYTAKCNNCAVSLTYHSGPKELRCHHCDASRPAPTTCPNCGGPHIRQFGVGTEKVELEARELFPGASIIRMDSDTTRRKGSHARLLNTFREGKADIMVGTQMIAKGLDFPNVSLVGVISADTSLHLPDFNSAERTFQLLTQVSGRAGRGDIPGEVIVQSFSPEHYAIQAAANHDYEGFYRQEIVFREELSYPPFSRLINIVSTDPVDGYAESRLREWVSRLDLPVGVEILGPAECPLSKLKGLYRWHVVLKDRSGNTELKSIVGASAPLSGLTFDVDPLSML